MFGMKKSEILKHYRNRIIRIQNEETKDELLDRLEDLDDILRELDTKINEAIELQEFGENPSMEEEWEDYKSIMKEIML